MISICTYVNIILDYGSDSPPPPPNAIATREGTIGQQWSSLQHAGWHYCEWAPAAHTCSLVGDFNGWDANQHPCRADSSGVFSTVVRLADGRGEGGRGGCTCAIRRRVPSTRRRDGRRSRGRASMCPLAVQVAAAAGRVLTFRRMRA